MSTRLPVGSAAAARRVTGSCGDFTLDGVKFRVVCRGNLEIGLESDTQVGLLAIGRAGQGPRRTLGLLLLRLLILVQRLGEVQLLPF